MKNQELQALAAMKTEVGAMTLPCILKRLQREKALVDDELNQMPADSWFNVRGRELMNREQELFTTLRVLEGLAAAPMQVTQITEPAN